LGALLLAALVGGIACAEHRGPFQPVIYSQPTRYFQYQGLDIAYLESGSGRPLILVHGLAGMISNWDPILTELAGRYRVIALDLPPFGNSSKTKTDLSIEFYADLIGALLDHLGLDRASILGHSMGGTVAATFAGRHPERVDKLILYSAGGAGQSEQSRGVKFVLKHPKLVTRWAVRLARWWTRGKSEDEIREIMLERGKGMGGGTGILSLDTSLQPELVARLREQYADFFARLFASDQRDNYLAGIIPLLGKVLTYDNPGVLKQIRAPTLIIWGDRDAGPVSVAEYFHSLVPGSKLVVIENMGHLGLVEQPKKISGAVIEFLE
jgi:pimeloyl-ACP methyl ester carboxylesterase